MPASKGAAEKAATLARVRENQRRCRARRRERILELEHKLRDFEAEKDPSEGNICDRMKRLERENERLQALLEVAGLPRVWMEAFLKFDDENGTRSGPFLSRQNVPDIATRSDSTLGDVIPRPSSTEFTDGETPAIKSFLPSATTSTGFETDFDFFNWTDMPSDLDLTQIVNDYAEPSIEAAAFPVLLENQITPAFATGTCCAERNHCPNSGNSDGDTTLCSAAFELVQRCNSRRLGMVEICVRLWSGFRAGERGREDCTVNNKVLFGVLDHISG